MATVRSTPPILSAKDIERFWSKIQKGPDCWIWTGGVFPSGYGKFKVQGKNRRAHRVAILIATGKWPEWPAIAMHKCDVRLCCRYDLQHVHWGSLQGNRDDCVRKGRHAYGERIGLAKLTENIVREIKKRIDQGESRPALAVEYKLGTSSIHRIANNQCWKHILK